MSSGAFFSGLLKWDGNEFYIEKSDGKIKYLNALMKLFDRKKIKVHIETNEPGDTPLDNSKEEIKILRKALEDIRDNFDHEDRETGNHAPCSCRVCIAETALAKLKF